MNISHAAKQNLFLVRSAFIATSETTLMHTETFICIASLMLHRGQNPNPNLLIDRSLKIAAVLVPALPSSIAAVLFTSFAVRDSRDYPYHQIEKIENGKKIYQAAALIALFCLSPIVAASMSDKNWETYEKNVYPIAAPLIQVIMLVSYTVRNLKF